MTPNVSVAMATYNGEAHLPAQLESLAHQRLLPYELVVCDDGSTDHTRDIIRAFAADAPFPVRVHRNEEHLGFADNFLKAASLCSGELIAFCDQDDVWLADKLNVCASAFTGPDVFVCLHQGRVVDDALQPTGRLHPKITARKRIAPIGFSPALPGTIVPPGFAMVFRASLLSVDTHHRPWTILESERLRGGPMNHDEWVWLLGASLGKPALVQRDLVLYRRHSHNTTGAPTRPTWRTTVSRAVRRTSYTRIATIDGQCRRLFGDLARGSGDPDLARRAARAARYFRRREAVDRLRASIYDPSSRLSMRVAALARRLVLGKLVYRELSGVVTWRALGKDLLLGVSGLSRLLVWVAERPPRGGGIVGP